MLTLVMRGGGVNCRGVSLGAARCFVVRYGEI